MQNELAVKTSKTCRTSYGVLIIVSEESLRLQGRLPDKRSPGSSEFGGGAYVLCVKSTTSYNLRDVFFLLKIQARYENVIKAVNKLSGRELGILRSRKQLRECLGRCYTHERKWIV